MIQIRFEEREKIGLQYILESLHGCSPFGQERIRRLRYYTPDEREELEQELRNVERAAVHAEELKDLYDQICVVLCQMKDIRGSLRRCRELEVPDHVELFELKGYLQRLETLRPLFEKLRDTTGLTGLAFHDPAAALAILDPENTRSRGFYIPDAATPRLREIRTAKKQVEEQLYRTQTDAEKDDLRQKRVRICAEEDSEEMKVRRAMGAALAPLADDLMADADTAGRPGFSHSEGAVCPPVRWGTAGNHRHRSGADGYDQPGAVRPFTGAGSFLCAGVHLSGPGRSGDHRRQHGRQVRGHENRGPERAAAAGGLPGLRQKRTDAPVLERAYAV